MLSLNHPHHMAGMTCVPTFAMIQCGQVRTTCPRCLNVPSSARAANWVHFTAQYVAVHMHTLLIGTQTRCEKRAGLFVLRGGAGGNATHTNNNRHTTNNNLRCSICGESNRRRQLAYIVNHVASEWARREISSIVEVGQLNMAIYNTEVCCANCINTQSPPPQQ